MGVVNANSLTFYTRDYPTGDVIATLVHFPQVMISLYSVCVFAGIFAAEAYEYVPATLDQIGVGDICISLAIFPSVLATM